MVLNNIRVIIKFFTFLYSSTPKFILILVAIDRLYIFILNENNSNF